MSETSFMVGWGTRPPLALRPTDDHLLSQRKKITAFFFADHEVDTPVLYAPSQIVNRARIVNWRISPSHMAQEWCLAYGVCPMDEAEQLYKAVCKRKGVAASASSPPSSPKKARQTQVYQTHVGDRK